MHILSTIFYINKTQLEQEGKNGPNAEKEANVPNNKANVNKTESGHKKPENSLSETKILAPDKSQSAAVTPLLPSKGLLASEDNGNLIAEQVKQSNIHENSDPVDTSIKNGKASANAILPLEDTEKSENKVIDEMKQQRKGCKIDSAMRNPAFNSRYCNTV